MARLVMRGLTKAFRGGTVAVDHVDLTVEDGEFVVLVGPSGCGKSTLLRMIAGLEDVTSGTIESDGVVINALAPKERDIAMVFQNYALYPHFTVAENMGFGLRMRKVPRHEAREEVEQAAHVLGLQALLGRRPAALSGGQRQRVAMGRALVRRPQIFLMDEPLSNLDAKLRVAMRAELMRLHQRYRTTTVYVTHDQVEAMTLGDRIAVLERGRLQQIGTPDELYHAPANVFVAGFIGSPAMNLARARVTRSGGTLWLTSEQQRWPLPASVAASLDPSVAEVVVGLRPDAFGPGEPAAATSLTVTAVTVEALGDEKNVLFVPPLLPIGSGEDGEQATDLWTARLDPDAPVHSGQSVTLVPDLAAVYLFDATTGVTLYSPRGATTTGPVTPPPAATAEPVVAATEPVAPAEPVAAAAEPVVAPAAALV